MYKSKTYTARPLDEVRAEIDAMADSFPQADRIFLADGDALTLPTDHLVSLLEYLAKKFPNLTRVSSYAMPKNLLDKPTEELTLLREKGLKLVYLGIESGSNLILKRIIKGASQKTHIKAIERAKQANIKISATVILGLGGRENWQEHIQGTAELINKAPPTYLSTLQLMLEDASYEEFMKNQPKDFSFQNDMGILEEQALLLSLLDPPRSLIFRSNHASNCLALAGNLPRDREQLLGQIEAVRASANLLHSDFLRQL